MPVPPGTPVAMTSVLVHNDARIFPEPEKFQPERWLNADGSRDRTLEKYILSFSRGSRQCLGIKCVVLMTGTDIIANKGL